MTEYIDIQALIEGQEDNQLEDLENFLSTVEVESEAA
jgi:beta-galactosidase beta subunit